MNAITGILSREYLSKNSHLNIIWTSVDNILFEERIKKLNHNLLSLDHLYFGKDSPHLIICNNKMIYHRKCKDISIQFHIPVLLIDHLPQVASKDPENRVQYEFPCSINVAMSSDIAKSWTDTRYDYTIEDKDYDQAMWSDIIYKTSKRIFKYYG